MSILRDRHTKILTTIGPASRSEEVLTKLVESGADAVRLNFSHGSHEDHRETFNLVRKVEKKLGQRITILQDLQGPKIRLGQFEEDRKYILEKGDTFTLDDNPAKGNQSRCQLPHPEILDVLKAGDSVYINDGLVRLKVSKKKKNEVICEVTAGGGVSDRKGVNLPGVDLPISSITKKDWEDLEFGLELGVDWVAVSFVQKAEDVDAVQKKVGNRAGVMAKIEMPNAVKRIDSIIKSSNGIMVARGDLGVEMPIEEVPAIQKKLIRLCREAGKPVVVATQMLESMIQNPSPTRAEVSDVANATFEGADALMLSAESAAGDYPVEAVQMMDATIHRAEKSSAWQPLIDARGVKPKNSVSDSITHSAYHCANLIEAKAIVCFTESGSTAMRMSRQRPIQHIITVTPHDKIARILGLVWGMSTYITTGSIEKQKHLVEHTNEALKSFDLHENGAQVVLTAGLPFGVVGTTNMLRIIKLGKE